MTITATTTATTATPPSPAVLAARTYRLQAGRRLEAVAQAARHSAGFDVVDHIVLAALIGAGRAAIGADDDFGHLAVAGRALEENRGDAADDPLESALIDALLAACYAAAGGPADRTAVHLGRAAAEFDQMPEQDALIPRALLALAYALAAKERG